MFSLLLADVLAFVLLLSNQTSAFAISPCPHRVEDAVPPSGRGDLGGSSAHSEVLGSGQPALAEARPGEVVADRPRLAKKVLRSRSTVMRAWCMVSVGCVGGEQVGFVAWSKGTGMRFLRVGH